MVLMSVNENTVSSNKEQLSYIFKSYINTRPGQSNIFSSILRSYRGDLLENAGNVELQMEAIKSSLREILGRYGYTKHDISIDFNEQANTFIIDIDSVTADGTSVKLSESVIFDKN